MDDDADDKKPSGYQYRKARKQREREDAAERAQALGIPLGTPEEGADEFAALGPPPLDSPETALAWVRRYQLTALHVAATRPLSDALEKRLRYVREFGATIGMTAQRSDLEELAERLEDMLAGAQQAAHAAARPVTNPRPHTARGTRRGPRPMDAAPTPDATDDPHPLKPV